MPYLLLGVLMLFASLWLAKTFIRADPRWLAARTRKLAGTALLALSALLFLRGGALLAIPLSIFALNLLGWGLSLGGVFDGIGAPKRTRGQSSTVRTLMLEMRLDHDTGAMTGRVLKGLYAGRELTGMRLDELLALWKDCQIRDPQGALLVETLLERIAPGWRAGLGGERRGRPSDGGMTIEEAYKVLGLQPGARRREIISAHRNLMKRFHPDQGGSNYLATKINEAKDVLLASES
jgi:hypothetical protein